MICKSLAALCATLLVCTAPKPVAEIAQFHHRLPLPERQILTVSEPKLEKLDNILLTHYCICEKCCGKTPDHPAYGITHSGRTAEPYISVAVDPDVIPLGSTVWLAYGDGRIVECRADDTGGAINGARIDLCVSSHSEALELGIDYITVYWKEGNDATLQR